MLRKTLTTLLITLFCTTIFAATKPTTNNTSAIEKTIQQAAKKNPYSERIKEEDKIAKDPFGVSLYKPSYLLPFYNTFSPYQSVYAGRTPDGQALKETEFKGQLSIKVPLWHKMFHTKTDLYVAYTQLSYWQVYTKSAYFRETNYEPELFISHQITNWATINGGVVHQSNGRGGDLERSWNRVYAEGILSLGNWMVSIKPWVLIFKNDSSRLHNPDITHYLGHGRFLFAYKFHKLVLSLKTRNNLESGFRRGSVEVAASYPVFSHVLAYVQFFSGYGQSLIEYNHHTNAAGIGIAFNNWI